MSDEPNESKAASSFGPSNYLRGIAGAIIGGAIGFIVFKLLYERGFYAGILPGALLGMGCGYASGGKSFAMGAICLIMAAILSVCGEWWCAPFAEDTSTPVDTTSLTYFLKNITELPNIKKGMLSLGTIAAMWFGVGREKLLTHSRKS